MYSYEYVLVRSYEYVLYIYEYSVSAYDVRSCKLMFTYLCTCTVYSFTHYSTNINYHDVMCISYKVCYNGIPTSFKVIIQLLSTLIGSKSRVRHACQVFIKYLSRLNIVYTVTVYMVTFLSNDLKIESVSIFRDLLRT